MGDLEKNLGDSEKVVKITYRTKDSVVCPLCGEIVFREEILSGGGRLVAGLLNDELHRAYEKTNKYGAIYPLVYTVTVCTNCYFAGFPSEFANAFLRKDEKDLLKNKCQESMDLVRSLCPEVNLLEKRTLIEGALSYLLALFSYEHAGHSEAPTLRKGMCCLRAAWLFGYLSSTFPGENYGHLEQMFHKKATFYYRKAVELDEQKIENLSKISYLGPDIDKNYGFDGVQYLTSLLLFKYGVRSDSVIRYRALENTRKILSKIVGMGKSTRMKPGPLLELSRDVYQQVKTELNEIIASGAVDSELE